jgi:hypothetical protein
MAGEASAQREKQDQSIKARKKELFVEEQALETGPRKKLRDYLKDTPAAPLSKQVKLSLWGAAVPVVLLFVAALMSPRSVAKAPDEMIIPAHAKPAPPTLTRRSDDKPLAPAVDSKPADRKDEAAANTDKPPQEKEKPKKKPTKKKGKPKETVVVQNADGDKAKSDEPADKDKGDKAGDSKRKPQTGSSASDSKDKSKDKMAANDDAKTKSATPEKPKQRAAPIFKKKKPEVRTYPKRDGDKKADPKTNPDPGDSAP